MNLPVGENLQSHAGPGGLYFSFTQKAGFYVPQIVTVDLLPNVLNYLLKGQGRPIGHAVHFSSVIYK